MKQLLYFVFGLLLLAGCNEDKTDDPTPKTPAEAIAGLYPMTAITAISTGKTTALPFADSGVNISGTVNVATIAGKQDETNMTVKLKATGSPDVDDNILVQVKAAGTGYELFESGQKLGMVEGNTLTITTDLLIIVAKK